MSYNNNKMGWHGLTYVYTVKALRAIAGNYARIYQGLELSNNNPVTDSLSIAEYVCDFDCALNRLGQSKRRSPRWTGEIYPFQYYKGFSRLQLIVIADILGMTELDLLRLGFYSIPRLRGYSYYLMARFLNGRLTGETKHKAKLIDSMV